MIKTEQHHTKYLELDGIDEIELISKKEHHTHRLERGFAIPVSIIKRAHARTSSGIITKRKCLLDYIHKNRQQIEFTERITKNFRLKEVIDYNNKTGNVTVVSYFRINNKKVI